MKHDHLVAQSPDKPAQQLSLSSHGVGDNPVVMGEIGSWLVPLFPNALVASIGGVESYGTTSGRQWFLVQGVTEENRQERVDAIMSVFIETVRYWQKQSGVSPQATALIGFSQGSIMPLESIEAEPGPVSRVIAFNGRHAILPGATTTATTVHLIHGGGDRVIELSHAVAAQEVLIRASGDVTLDIVENPGHAIDECSMQFALGHLRFTVPKYYLDEALSGGKSHGDNVIIMIWLITVGRIARETLPAGT